MGNIVKSLSQVRGLEGKYDVVAMGEGVSAYVVNCKALNSVRFNDPADAGFYVSFTGTNHADSPEYPDYPASSFAYRCIASLVPKSEPNNPIMLPINGKIENIRIYFPLHHSLTKSLIPEGNGSSFRPFDLYETGWQMALTGDIRKIAMSIWNNDYKGTSRSLWLKGKLYELLALLIVHREPRTLAERACERITQQPYLNWNIPGLARELATNECYLKQAFKQQFDMGVASWIQAFRIGLAKEQLLEPNESITQIALALGYQNGSYFSKVFKQHTGQTPREFRNSLPCKPKKPTT